MTSVGDIAQISCCWKEVFALVLSVYPLFFHSMIEQRFPERIKKQEKTGKRKEREREKQTNKQTNKTNKQTMDHADL